MESFFCTGPAVCNYDVSNGDKEYKYSGMDFTNGQVVLNQESLRSLTCSSGQTSEAVEQHLNMILEKDIILESTNHLEVALYH